MIVTPSTRSSTRIPASRAASLTPAPSRNSFSPAGRASPVDPFRITVTAISPLSSPARTPHSASPAGSVTMSTAAASTSRTASASALVSSGTSGAAQTVSDPPSVTAAAPYSDANFLIIACKSMGSRAGRANASSASRRSESASSSKYAASANRATLDASTPRANLARSTSRLRASPLSGFLSSCAARSARRSSALCHRASTALLIRPPPRRPAPRARQPALPARGASSEPSRSARPCPPCSRRATARTRIRTSRRTL